MSKPLNRRVASLEAHRAAHRVGAEIYRRMPDDPRNTEAACRALSDVDLDELTRFLRAEYPHHPDFEAMTDAELDNVEADLSARLGLEEGDDPPLVAT